MIVIRNKNLDGDYNTLENKPQINGVELSGNKTASDLGLEVDGDYLATTGGTLTGSLTFDGAGIIDVDYIDCNTDATSTRKEGRLRWNAEDKCWEFDSIDTTTNQIGQELWTRVRNTTGATIDNGCAVYVSGANGNRPTIAKARANAEATSLKFLGLTTADIEHNADGFVTVLGTVRGVDTNAYTVGDTLYLSDTVAGGFRTTRPDAPNTTVVVGMVKTKSGTGDIAVQPRILPTLDRLSNVYTTGLTSGDVLKYSGTRWENGTTDIYKTFAGFVNRTDSTIAINGSGVVTLAPSVTSYTVYTMGVKHVLTSTQTVSVTDDQTLTYIYLDSAGLLQKNTSAWDITSGANIPVAICFKDGSTYSLTDERHSYERNRAWHSWAHNNIGTMYKSGLTGTFANTTLSVTQGVIYDEDIKFDTLGTKTATSLWYRNATSGMRLVRGATACKSVSGGGVLQYDNGSGTLQDVTQERYVTNWVYCSNDPTEPIYTVVGQNNSTSLTSARNTPAPTINLSTAEWKLIYKVIYQRLEATPSGVFVEATDYRAVQTGVPTASVITDHATLINRDASNSHPATAISYSTTSVGAELDARINKTYTLTIDVGEWTANSYSQVVTGLTDNDLAIIQAPDSYYTTYGLSYTQSGDTITFTVTSTPLVSLTIGVGMVKCSAGGSL